MERMFRRSSMKKKIGIYLSAKPHSGGKFQYTQSMLSALQSLPHDKYSLVVAFASLEWEGILGNRVERRLFVPGGLLKWFHDRVWRNLGLSPTAWRYTASIISRHYRKMRKEKCDLWIFPAEETVSYQLNVPTLATIYDLMHRYENSFPEVGAYGRARRRDRHYSRMCRYCRGILVDSEVGKRQLIESYGIDSHRVFSLPFVPPPYMYRKDSLVKSMEKYTLPEKYVFYPAQFWKHKNHERLVRAIALLKKKVPDIKLVLVGSKKNAYESIVELVKKMGLSKEVFFLGYVPEECMPDIYRRARALVMPTHFGPTNIPPLEAFCAGCPVAVSGIYGMPEQVGDAAILFDPSSVEEIADAIEAIWNDDVLCEKLKERGYQRARMWGQEQFNERLRCIVENLLDGGEE